jgi:hypothetical protein
MYDVQSTTTLKRNLTAGRLKQRVGGTVLLLGDLVSIYAAVLRAADPLDIPAIDGLKAALAAR